MNLRRQAAIGLMAFSLGCAPPTDTPEFWTDTELLLIDSLRLSQLPPVPPSPGNPVADDERAITMGHRLFFDPGLSANAKVACSTCHQPQRNFKDGLKKAQGIGTTPRKSMSVVGTAYSPWLFWDGRADSLWSQALKPLEDPGEQGLDRVELARLIATSPTYRSDYIALFGALPPLNDRNRFPPASPEGTAGQRAAWLAMAPEDRKAVNTIFANIGRALEAYQRRLQYGPAPFDAFADALLSGDQVAADKILDKEQRAGLRLFLGRANCVHCHNGPLFTNNEFHNNSVDGFGAAITDKGRIQGIKTLLADDFNCLGEFSGADEKDCAELRFIKASGSELNGAFRTVSLRNIAGQGPFMHNGQFDSLTDVLNHYNLAQPTRFNPDLQPLRLTDEQIAQIVAFLESLSAPLAVEEKLLRPPAG